MSKYSNIAHYQDFTELETILSNSSNSYDMGKIRMAYDVAEKAHGDQRRVSGIPYILHPTSVACIVAELGMDTDSICGALLHDVVEDTSVSLEAIKKHFGEDVAKLIDGVTKISKIPFSSREQEQAENIRKMLIAMADDIRVIIIKLADRLHNMRTMDCMPEQKRRDKSLENMQVLPRSRTDSVSRLSRTSLRTVRCNILTRSATRRSRTRSSLTKRAETNLLRT